MGGEIGQWKEWNHDDQLDWVLLEFDAHRKLQHLVKALNRIYRAEPALHEVDFTWEGFQWIDFRDIDSSVVSFYRRAKDPHDLIVVVANFTPVVRHNYRVGVPSAGTYREILNTDAEPFGGSNALNLGDIASLEGEWQAQPHSVVLRLPPLGIIYLKPERTLGPDHHDAGTS
jgi:1,4-alpha-glucan branching enzyme